MCSMRCSVLRTRVPSNCDNSRRVSEAAFEGHAPRRLHQVVTSEVAMQPPRERTGSDEGRSIRRVGLDPQAPVSPGRHRHASDRRWRTPADPTATASRGGRSDTDAPASARRTCASPGAPIKTDPPPAMPHRPECLPPRGPRLRPCGAETDAGARASRMDDPESAHAAPGIEPRAVDVAPPARSRSGSADHDAAVRRSVVSTWPRTRLRTGRPCGRRRPC